MPLTTKEWAKGIERGWKLAADKATKYADGIIGAQVPHADLAYAEDVATGVANQARDLRVFLEAWQRDAQINRGLWTRVPDKIDRKRGVIKDIQRVLSHIHDATEVVADVPNYADAIWQRLNPKSGWKHEPGMLTSERDFAFTVLGFAHKLKEAVEAATKHVQQAVKYAKDLPDNTEQILPDDVDVNGMKVVFEDVDTKSKPTDKTPRSPWTRANVVKAMDMARQLLERKGLGFLWYGVMRVLPREHYEADVSRYGPGLKTTSSHMAANYDYRKDLMTMFSDIDAGEERGVARTIAHELGHRFWFKFMTETDRAKFRDEFGDVLAVSEYGGSNPEEDFAEVFSHYVDGRDLSSDQLERLRSYLTAHKRRKASAEDAEAAVAAVVKKYPMLGPWLSGPIRSGVPRSGRHPEAAIEKGELHIYPKFYGLDTTTKDFVIAHEVGHLVLAAYGLQPFTITAATLGVDVWNNLPFSQHNMDEAFADSFATFVIDRADLERRYPAWAELVEMVVAGSKTASVHLDEALDELAAPIRLWVHHPETEGKVALAEAYAALSPAAKAALAADVLRVCPGPFMAFRRTKGGPADLRGLDSVSTDQPPAHVTFESYRLEPEHVLVHWKQDTPLGRGSFAHEHEVILKPGVTMPPFRAYARLRAVEQQLAAMLSQKPTTAGGMDGFDLFDDVEDVPETEAQAQRREFTENIGYGDIIQIGNRKFRVFRSEGVVKYVTLHGTKGRNMYQVIVDGDDPFTVNVFEMVDYQTPSKTVFTSGTPKKVGHAAARTLDVPRESRILPPMTTKKTAKAIVSKPVADKLAKRAARVAAGEATVPLAVALAQLGLR